MPDLHESLLPELENHRLPDLDLGPGIAFPHYEGRSILNLPASWSRWLGGPELHHPALDIQALDALAEGVEQVVVCLIDALGYLRLRRWLDGPARRLRPLIEQGLLAPLTSVAPSTTSAALTTIWTGRSPAEHGILGYELFLREYGMIANMIQHNPATFSAGSGMLEQAGFVPEAFLPVDPLGPTYRRARIEVHAFMPYALLGSGLSRMHLPSIEGHRYGTIADGWLAIRSLAESEPGARRLIWMYIPTLDSLSHRFGPESIQVQADLELNLEAMFKLFLEPFQEQGRQNSLFLLLADHGQIATQPDGHYTLAGHPNLARRLVMVPSGENRLAYLFPRPGQVSAVEEYIARTWPGGFTALPSGHALEAGLFGPGRPASGSRERLGERVLVTHGGAYLWWAGGEDPLRGRHGGLSPEEMWVPLIAARL